MAAFGISGVQSTALNAKQLISKINVTHIITCGLASSGSGYSTEAG
jgi:hypothetical protein